MDTWAPENLCKCVGSPFLGWTTAFLAAGILVWYMLIALRWLEASKFASIDGRSVWRFLVFIFIVCASAGYGSWILALFWPKAAVVLRIGFLASQNILCPIFCIKPQD